MELKFEKNGRNHCKPFGFNCTFMELKLLLRLILLLSFACFN